MEKRNTTPRKDEGTKTLVIYVKYTDSSTENQMAPATPLLLTLSLPTASFECRFEKFLILIWKGIPDTYERRDYEELADW